MNYKTFERLLNSCKDLYEEGCARDRRMSDVLGGDTAVMTDWWDVYITNTLDALKEEFNDKDETIDWLFWESMTNNGEYLDFTVDDVNYIGNPKNVYLELTGMLDERLGETVKTEEQNDEILNTPDVNSYEIVNELTKEEIVDAHDEKKINEIDVTHSVDGRNPWSPVENESVSTRNHKLFLLKDKQITLESVMLSNLLKEAVDELIDNENISFVYFSELLNAEFESLMLDAKHKDTLKKMEMQFKMVLSQFVGEKIDEKSMSMINLEIKKILNNLKELNSIFDYDVYEPSMKDAIIRIEGTWLWEDINERQKAFGIEIGEELKIGFK